MDKEPFAHSEGTPEAVPFYRRPEVIARAQQDERLADRLHGLELADQGRQIRISQELHRQMEQSVSEYLQQAHPDLWPGAEPTDRHS